MWRLFIGTSRCAKIVINIVLANVCGFLVPVGKIASLGLRIRRRRIAETRLQLLCDAIKVRKLCRECKFKDRCPRIWSVGV